MLGRRKRGEMPISSGSSGNPHGNCTFRRRAAKRFESKNPRGPLLTEYGRPLFRHGQHLYREGSRK